MSIPAENAAVVLIEPQNDFLSPGGGRAARAGDGDAGRLGHRCVATGHTRAGDRAAYIFPKIGKVVTADEFLSQVK